MDIIKSKLRSQMRNSIRQLDHQSQSMQTTLCIQKIISSHAFVTSQSICCYIPLIEREINTYELIKISFDCNKRVFVPSGDLLFKFPLINEKYKHNIAIIKSDGTKKRRYEIC